MVSFFILIYNPFGINLIRWHEDLTSHKWFFNYFSTVYSIILSSWTSLLKSDLSRCNSYSYDSVLNVDKRHVWSQQSTHTDGVFPPSPKVCLCPFVVNPPFPTCQPLATLISSLWSCGFAFSCMSMKYTTYRLFWVQLFHLLKCFWHSSMPLFVSAVHPSYWWEVFHCRDTPQLRDSIFHH